MSKKFSEMFKKCLFLSLCFINLTYPFIYIVSTFKKQKKSFIHVYICIQYNILLYLIEQYNKLKLTI